MNINKNVKAFTLIELLAVIVILAIIALIATPIILGVINDSKEKAFKLSLNNVFHAGEIYMTQNSIKPGTTIDIKDLPLDSKNLAGKIVINAEEEVEIKQITDGTYSAAGAKDHINIIKGSIEDLLENILTITVNKNGSTRNSITVAVEADGVPISYSYTIKGQDNKQIGNTVTNSEPSYTFTGLEANKEYIIEVTATNRAGLNGYDKKTLSTSEVTVPSLKLTPTYEEDNGKDYIRAGKVTIEYTFIEEGLINAYRWDDWEDERFEEYTGEIEAKNGNLIAVILDGEETVVSKVLQIDKIDNTDPKVTLFSEQTTTNSMVIPFSVEEKHIDKTKTTCVYGESTSYGSNGVIKNNTCEIKNLKNNKTYYYKVCASDLAGNEGCAAGSTKTEDITNPVITFDKEFVNNYVKEEATATVPFTNSEMSNYIRTTRVGTTNINTLEVCDNVNEKPSNCTSSSVKTLEVDKWYKVSGNINVTYNIETNEVGTIFALTYDGVNYGGASTGVIPKIDKTYPELTFGTTMKSPTSIEINYTIDDKAGVGVDASGVVCKLGTSKGTYNIAGPATLTKCTASGLQNNQNYYYQICVTDKVGNKNNECYESEITIPAPTINVTHYNASGNSINPSTTNNYSYKERATVTFTNTGLTNPIYYIKTTRATSNSISRKSCGTGTNPGECTGSFTSGTLSANTWYQVSSTSITLYYENQGSTNTEGYVYARTTEVTNSVSSEGTLLRIDKNAPSISFTNITTESNRMWVTINASDVSGVSYIDWHYGYDNDKWYSLCSNCSSYRDYFTKNGETVYFYAVDKLGNTNKQTPDSKLVQY